MKLTIKKCAVFSVLIISLMLLPVHAAELQEKALTPELLEQVRQGGYVLYIRHGKTDSSIPDQVPVDLDNCASQRPLTEAGYQQMVSVGENIRALGLPVGEIFVSPFCRTRASADAAFGENTWQLENLLMYTAAMTRAEKDPVVARTRALVSLPVLTPGKNRVLLAHGPNLAEIMSYFPPEGTLVIIKPMGDAGFEYQASIRPENWVDLLKGL
ncbi:MAG: histidine phosphatase family protein [Marinospirillum sp.]|uniref:histidine phosphatase family protein n=1 Tax=Marinospirillum sp. TaxID=2183934 RepID=UPI001A046B47|nr:histidine phosphatase family protein [Marinospirillum sp.]MBE0508749.1 histidine phosphatase family protein [Marinospirillum sp.]